MVVIFPSQSHMGLCSRSRTGQKSVSWVKGFTRVPELCPGCSPVLLLPILTPATLHPGEPPQPSGCQPGPLGAPLLSSLVPATSPALFLLCHFPRCHCVTLLRALAPHRSSCAFSPCMPRSSQCWCLAAEAGIRRWEELPSISCK